MLKEFSYPMCGDYVSLYGYVADKLFYALADKLQEQGHAKITKALDRRPLQGRSWLPPAGFVRTGWQDDPDWADVQLALVAHSAGLLSEFEAELAPGAQPLMIGGRMFPPGRYRIAASYDRVRLSSQERGELVFNRSEHGHYLLDPDDAVTLMESFTLIHSQGEWLQYKEPLQAVVPLSRDRRGSVEAVDAVLSALAESVPEYLLWVLLPIKEITFLHPIDPRTTQSRSSSIFPGNIQITAPGQLPRLVAQLVHECSHQYFHLGQWIGPVTLPDAPMAFSILKNTYRPLDRVLLGYHAFANIYMALMLLRIRASSLDAGELDSEIRHSLNSLRQLGGALDSNEEHLTEIGRDIYLPLRSAVAELEAA